MGARNRKESQSPLHSEIEALIWATECMRDLRRFTFATDCSQLTKMVSEPKEWPVFASYLEYIMILKRNFNSSELQSRTLCKEATVVCCPYGWKSTSLVCKVYMNMFKLLTKKCKAHVNYQFCKAFIKYKIILKYAISCMFYITISPMQIQLYKNVYTNNN